MPRPLPQPPNPPKQDRMFPNVILADSAVDSGTIKEFDFNNGTVPYFDFKIRQNFQYVLFDNRGPGMIRVCYNRPSLPMQNPINGAKTLGPGEALYIEEDIWHIGIHYLNASSVEIILKANANNGDGL